MHKLAQDFPPASAVAEAYDASGAIYGRYADGDGADLFRFSGKHAYADAQVWHWLSAKLTELRQAGNTRIRVLDAGCGPGTWIRRIVVRARELGFTTVVARGFDLSAAQIEQARAKCADLVAVPGVHLNFEVADLSGRLREADHSVDLTLCLYSVLSHVPMTDLPFATRELQRVTRGYFVTTVRALGSMPSALVASIEQVRHLCHDQRSNWCKVELEDGRRMAFDFHLFSTFELREYFEAGLEIETLQGLDFFHSRFAADPRWNPDGLEFPIALDSELAGLETIFASNPAFCDHANHLLLIGRAVRADSGREARKQQRERLSLRALSRAERQ